MIAKALTASLQWFGDLLYLPWGRPWHQGQTISDILSARPVQKLIVPLTPSMSYWRGVAAPSIYHPIRLLLIWLATGWIGPVGQRSLSRLLTRLDSESSNAKQLARISTQLYGFSLAAATRIPFEDFLVATPYDTDQPAPPAAMRVAMPAASALARVARWLIDSATHPEAAGLGLALLVRHGHPGDLSITTPFFREEGFADLALRAARTLEPDSLQRWRNLREQLSIHQSAELLGDIADQAKFTPELRQWLICSAPYEAPFFPMMAMRCATAVSFDEILADADVPQATLAGTACVLYHICGDGVLDAISRLHNGPKIFHLALHHLARQIDRMTLSIETLALAITVSEWLTEISDDDEMTGRARSLGWSNTLRQESLDQAHRIISSPAWIHIITQALADKSLDPMLRSQYWRLAPFVGIDPWPESFDALTHGESALMLWRDVLDTDNAERLGQAVELAEESWSTADQSARDAMVRAIPDLLDGMLRAGKYNPTLVIAALSEGDRRSRLTALRVLTGKSWDEWGDEVRAAYGLACQEEPDDMLQIAMTRLARSRYDGWVGHRGADPRRPPSWLPSNAPPGRRRQ